MSVPSGARLSGRTIALLVGPLFEDVEVLYPKLRLEEEGAEVVCVGYSLSAYRGLFWSLALAGRGLRTIPGVAEPVYVGIHGMPVAAQTNVEDLDIDEIDAVVVPGGYAADHLRRSDAVLSFCADAVASKKPVAAICHGPWVLLSAGLVERRHLTSHWVIRPELEAAGAQWRDEPCVVDGPIITARFPSDLGPFCRALTDGLGTRHSRDGADSRAS